MAYDHVIIGAGISGITSALLLARHGRSVALVEKSRNIAPLLRGFSRQGFYFDTGFHHTGGLAEGGILALFLSYLGLGGKLEPLPFDPGCFSLLRSSHPDYEFAFPYGQQSVREALCQAFSAERQAIERYLEAVRRACARLPYLDLDAGVNTPQELPGAGPSLQDVLDSLTENALLKYVLSSHCLLYGVPPEEAPFLLHAAVVGPYYDSVHSLKGGGRALARALEVELDSLGVDVYTGAGAQEVAFSPGGSLSGVRLADGTLLGCRGCIATIHPRLLLDLVPANLFRPAYVSRLRNLRDTHSAFIIYGACDEPISALSGRSIILSANLATGCGNAADPAGGAVYVTAASPVEGTPGRGFIAVRPMSPEQTEVWRDSLTGSRPATYEAFKREAAEAVLGRLRAFCPEIEGSLSCIEAATPLTMRDYNHTPTGSLYGVKHMVGQRNPTTQTRVRELLLAGQAVAAPGVLGAMISGFLACGAILGHDRLRKELLACRDGGLS